MIIKPKTLVAGAVVGIFAATAFGDIAALDEVQDRFGAFPIPTTQVLTSATATPAITYQFAGLDEMRKHQPKKIKSDNWAVLSSD